MLSTEDICAGLTEAALQGRPFCLHSSYRSLGGLEGGPPALIEAMLACGCTVMTPTFSYACMVAPPVDQHPPRNAYDYDKPEDQSVDEAQCFDTDDSKLSVANMGAIPAALLARAGRRRGHHPICSFSAVGPTADALIGGQRPGDVFAPLRALADLGGAVLLLGVDLNKLTLVHAAEQLAGRRPFIRWAKTRDNPTCAALCGGCANGYLQLAPHLDDLLRTVQVGPSRWLCAEADQLLERLVTLIRHDPAITRCDDPDCQRCLDSIAGGPIGMEELA